MKRLFYFFLGVGSVFALISFIFKKIDKFVSRIHCIELEALVTYKLIPDLKNFIVALFECLLYGYPMTLTHFRRTHSYGYRRRSVPYYRPYSSYRNYKDDNLTKEEGEDEDEY